MPALQTVEFVRLGLLAMLMAAAIWFDTTQRRLPNSLVLLTLVIGAVTAIAQYGLPAFGANALHCLIALAIAMAIYAIGWIGAGDAKFYAAVAVWFPLSQALQVLLMVSVLGLVLVLGWLVVRRATRAGNPMRDRNGKFPLGVPIAAGACAHLLRLVLMW